MKIQEYSKSKGRYYFFCPGCREFHSVNTVTAHRDGLKFQLQGDKNNPTFVPLNQVIERTIESFNKSLHATNPGHVCLSVIRTGHIRFLGSCTHTLAGQMVPLPDLKPDQI